MSDTWKGDNLANSFDQFVDQIHKLGFLYLGQGSFRRGFYRKGVVIKVPIYSDGLIDNMVEARAYKEYRNGPTSEGLFLAPCRLLPNGCLMMVMVQRGLLITPDWTRTIDGGQVGMYKNRVVAYDYALDIPERFKWEKEWRKRSEFFHSREWEEQCSSKQVLDHMRRMRQESAA